MLPEIARHSEKFYYFYHVAIEGSLQSTARKINISAPSLSHAIKQLESIIGVNLFNRSKTGVTLTSAGEKLFLFCKRNYRDMEDVQRSMSQPDELPLRKIKIGTFQSIALYFWPLLIDSLDKKSQLSLSITTDRSKAILEALVKKNVDIALTVETLEHEKITKHELYKDEYAFYISSKNKKSNISRDELKKMAILYIPDAIDENGKSLRQYINSWGLSFNDEFELDSLEVIAEFTIKNYGLGILPVRVANTYGKALKVVSIEGLKISSFGAHRFFLSYRNDLDLPASLIKLFLTTATKAALQLNSNIN